MDQDVTKELAQGLPPYYPHDEDSPNFDLLAPIGEALYLDDITIEEFNHALRPQDGMAQELVVPRGESFTIRKDNRLYRTSVEIEGELIVDGELITQEVTIGSAGELTVRDGEVVEEEQIDEFITRLEKLGQLVNVHPYKDETIAHYRARIIAEYAVMTAEGAIEDVLTSSSLILDVPESTIDIDDRTGPGEASISLPGLALENTQLSDAEIGEVLERLIPASYSLDALRRGTFTYITPSQYDINDHDADLGYDGLDNGESKDNGGTYAGIIT